MRDVASYHIYAKDILIWREKDFEYVAINFGMFFLNNILTTHLCLYFPDILGTWLNPPPPSTDATHPNTRHATVKISIVSTNRQKTRHKDATDATQDDQHGKEKCGKFSKYNNKQTVGESFLRRLRKLFLHLGCKKCNVIV